MPNLLIFDGTVPPGERGDGCLVPSTPTHESILPRFDAAWLLSDDEIDERSLAIKDIVLNRAESTPWSFQGDQGSCTTAGSEHCILDRNAEEGEKVEPLSRASLYAWDGIDSNGNLIPRRADNGMALATGILLLRKIGMAPASLIDPMDYRGWRNWPKGWEQKADDNKLLEWKRLLGLRAIKSALVRPVPVLHGWGGHARCVVWWDPRERTFHCKNSWKSQPWHYLTTRQIEEGERQYECFGLFSTVAR